jgi:hypothetical protein
MAVSPKIIYLETDEEITSVVDKLRKTEFKKVILVIPKEASLLQSVVNLKLLKRQAENLEKQLAVVTADKTGRNLAQKVGILASAKLEEVVNEAEFVPVPLEETVPEEVEDTERPVEKSNSPIKETNEVIFKSKPEKKSVATDDDDEEPLTIREEADEELVEEEAFSKKPIEEVGEENLMPKLPKKKFFIIAGVIAIVLLALAYIYIPRARATILVKAEQKPISINFTGQKDTALDTDKAIVPVQVVESQKESSKKFTATGKKNVGNKASGTLRIGNDSGQDINWVTGTRFVPTNNTSIVFRTTTPVYAPDGQFTNIVVQADQPGDEYNGFGSNQTFTLAASSLSSTISIRCKDGMTGGSNKEVTYVTQSDINTAKDNLAKDAVNDAKSDFDSKTKDLKVVDDTKKEATLSANSSPEVNTESSDFTMTVKVSIKALAFSSGDVSKIVKADVERELGFAKKIIDDGTADLSVNVDEANLDNATLSGTIKTNVYVSSKIDENQIKTELNGLSESKARSYLTGLDGVQEVRLEFFPSFIKSFPRLGNHIFLSIQVADKESD